jgi:hypothetical protein
VQRDLRLRQRLFGSRAEEAERSAAKGSSAWGNGHWALEI